jgi:hypothetical protein
MALPKHLSKYWSGSDSREYELMAVWCPNEEPDAWARYRNITEDREYTCRLEAFLSRFRPAPD